MSCCSCSQKAKGSSFVGVGTLFIFIGVLLVCLWESIYTGILYSELSLNPRSTSYKIWKQPPIPIYLEVYLYNITNSNEISKGNWSVKPNLTEHGPYVFLEKHYRINETWNDNHTVSYKQIKTWEFQPNLTRGSLNDKITNLNVITATVGNLIKNKNSVIKFAVNWLLKDEGEKLLITKTVRELLFDGYDDKLLGLVANLSIPGLNIPFSKFGWFYGRNNSEDYDGSFEMWTGTDKLDKLGMLTKWNGKNRTKNYGSPCDSVKGSTGELWPPAGDFPNKTVNLFSSDMCSYITLDLDLSPEVPEKHGLEGIRYVGSQRSFDNGTYFPDQKCFVNLNNTKPYLPRGIRDTSKCRFGAPAFLSFPHFYLADESLLKNFTGLKPDPKKHQLSIELEPKTGLPLQILARVQINIRTEKIAGLRMFSHGNIRYWPMIWFTQRAVLTEDLASQVRSLLVLEYLGPYTGWGFTGFGILFIAIGLAVLVNVWHRNQSETRPLVTS